MFLKFFPRIANAHVLEQGAQNVVGTKRKMPATPKQYNVSNKIPKLCGPSNQTTLTKTTRQQKVCEV